MQEPKWRVKQYLKQFNQLIYGGKEEKKESPMKSQGFEWDYLMCIFSLKASSIPS